MSKRRKIIVLLACGLFVMAFLLFRRAHEPYYKGQPLSEWAISYAANTNQEAETAIRGIGTNAIPCLVSWMLYHPAPSKEIWLARINQPIGWLGDKLNADSDWTIEDRDRKRASAAIFAFRHIYQDAKLAVPDLGRLLNTANNYPPASWDTADYAAHALALRGEAGLPPFLEALNNRSNGITRGIALGNVGGLGTNVSAAVPVLIKILEEDNVGESRMASRTLGRLKLAPHIVVPALIDSLRSKDTVTTAVSTLSLAEFGPLAHSAIPDLTNQLTSRDPALSGAAAFALHAIEPSTYTNGGPARFEGFIRSGN